MKRNDLNSLRNKSERELQDLIDKKTAEAVVVKINMKVSKEKNLKNVKMLRRDISQISTILREKMLLKEDTEKENVKENVNK